MLIIQYNNHLTFKFCPQVIPRRTPAIHVNALSVRVIGISSGGEAL
jgi:hypothetical protein